MIKSTLSLFAVSLTALLFSSCASPYHGSASTREGAVIGGLLGAAVGGIIGNQSGRGLEGAAIGAGAGALAGGVYGSAEDERSERYRREGHAQAAPPYRESRESYRRPDYYRNSRSSYRRSSASVNYGYYDYGPSYRYGHSSYCRPRGYYW